MKKQQAIYTLANYYNSKPLPEDTLEDIVKIDTMAHRFLVCLIECVGDLTESEFTSLFSGVVATASLAKMLIRSKEGGSDGSGTSS